MHFSKLARPFAARAVRRPQCLQRVSPAPIVCAPVSSCRSRSTALVHQQQAAAYSQAAQPILTMDMALSATNATRVQLDRGLQCGALEEIKAQQRAVHLADRWHAMLNIFMSTVVNNIVPLGFSADQQGVMDYNKQFSALLASGEDDARDLQGLNKEIWQTMLTKGFDADFGEPIHLERAREIQAKISAHVLSPAFLARVDASTKDVATASNAEKHSSLMKLVMEGQMEVISDFGYEGDVGFVQYQAQVMEHSTDVIMQSNTAALMSLYERAGLQTA